MYNQVSYPKTVEAKERGFQALNKHFKLLGVLLLAMVLLAIPFAVQADAAEGQSVVYLMDGATGDGSSPESPTKSINTAFAALDNSLDCTVVVCGPFTHVANNYFVRQNWPKSVTITSVYGGWDYRETNNAVYNTAGGIRFYCSGATTFENITFKNTATKNKFFLVVGAHHPITVGEGVVMEDYPGGATATAFSILGGYQAKSGTNGAAPKTTNTDPVNITLKSGNSLVVIGYCRGISTAGKVYGDANITVEGTAQVDALYLTTAQSPNTSLGNVNLTVTDQAQVDQVISVANAGTTAENITVNWNGGSIGALDWINPAAGNVAGEVTGTTTLHASDAALAAANYAEIAKGFDAAPVKLAAASVTAAIYSNNTATVRYIVSLDVAEGQTVESYGVMVAQNAEKVNIATATLTEPFTGTTTYAVDLVNIPDTALDTEIYAWAYVNLAGGTQIVLPLKAVTVNGLIPQE